ncbi:trimeric LpxA-like protein, partial [Hyaloscypha variabilis F]
MDKIDDAENEARMKRGELYYAFTPAMVAKRERCKKAYNKLNQETVDATRRRRVELWKEICGDQTPLPPPAATEADDEILLQDEPFVEGPIKFDYGHNVILGKGVFINCNCTFIDTSPITIGSRTLVGPNCSFFSGTHPLDPFLRNGVKGPELGAPITIGEDCWFGGNAIVLPGVTI